MPEQPDPIDRLRAHADVGLDVDSHTEMADRVRNRLQQTAAAPKRRRPRWAIALPAGCAALVVTAAATAATGLWSPLLGSDLSGHPTVANTDVPADQLAEFGVLRRPADATDRDTITQAALRYLDSEFSGVRTQRIRAIQGLPGDTRYLIIPVEKSSTGIADALCLFDVNQTQPSAGYSCWSTQQILTGQAVLVTGLGSQHGTPRSAANPESLQPTTAGAISIGLVPDGVASVAASDGEVAEVHDNAYVTHDVSPTSGPVTWRDSDGKTVPQG